MTRDFKRDVINSRIAVLKAMDNAVRNMNDEDGFYSLWLVLGAPDGANEDDYRFIAENHDEYTSVVAVFAKIVKNYAEEDF